MSLTEFLVYCGIVLNKIIVCMKRFSILAVLAVLAALAVSCGGSGKKLLPNVSGKAGEVIVVINQTDWEGEVDARCGLVRTAYASGRFDVAVSEASMLLNSSLPAGEASRILYLRASAYSRLGESEAAHADLVKLAADKRSVYGAEAAYRLGEDCLVNNDMDGAAAYASELVSSGTGQRYWVARAIILLSDVSYRKGDRYKAVQYLKSLSENYDEDDDIKGIIEKKLLLYSD